MKITTPLLAALILGGRLTITGTAFASEHVASTLETSESVQSSQTNQETSALRRLALALSAGMRLYALCVVHKLRVVRRTDSNPLFQAWNVMWIVSLAMSHATALRCATKRKPAIFSQNSSTNFNRYCRQIGGEEFKKSRPDSIRSEVIPMRIRSLTLTSISI